MRPENGLRDAAVLAKPTTTTAFFRYRPLPATQAPLKRSIALLTLSAFSDRRSRRSMGSGRIRGSRKSALVGFSKQGCRKHHESAHELRQAQALAEYQSR